MSRDISIIISADDGASPTSKYLNIVLEYVPAHVDYEMIVVSDAPPDIDEPLLKRYGDRLRVVAPTSTRCFAASCNDGAAAASGEYLVLLSEELTPRAGWLEALLSYAGRRPAAAAIGSKILLPNNTIYHAGVAICQDYYPRHLYVGFPVDHPAVNKSRRFQVVRMNGALIRRELFEQAGGFDTAFQNGYEDIDLCLRMGEQGAEIHYCHRSLLYHVQPATDTAFARDEDTGRLYWRQWAHRVQPDDMRYYLEDGLLNVSYNEGHPVQLALSPLLGAAGGHGRGAPADRLLNDRSRQVGDLLKDLIRLTMRFGDMELRVTERLDALAARIDLIASGEEELRGMLLDARAQFQRRDDEIHTTLDNFQSALLALRQQGAPDADALGYRHQKLIHRVSYQQLADRIYEIVQLAVPPDATVVVVSKGDDDLLKLDGRRGWHFPRMENGQYAGSYPVDSAEAIAHLEALRVQGANFLLFPNTAFWWLGYYGDFHRHLDEHYQRIWSDKSSIIYQLDETPWRVPVGVADEEGASYDQASKEV